MTLEIIVFILAILFGIMVYWRESKNNGVYRFINHLTHNDELQMKPENRKGFIHQQPFLFRLVYITLLFVVLGAILSFATPVNAFYVQYFVSAIVGALIGTYIASLFLFAKKKTKAETFQKAFEKSKEKVEDFVDDVKEKLDHENDNTSKANKNTQQTTKTDPPAKSARDRFKDKGMIK